MLEKKQQYDLEQVVQEVESLYKLDHPNIVKYFETYNDAKYIYLVMEYVTGQQLFEKICSDENFAFCEQQARKYMQQILSAVKHCHVHGIVHRDLKPENILVTPANNIRIIDFGLSRKGSSESEPGQIAGTPFYIAPEIIDQKPYGTKADMWSIGIVLYVLLSGYMPFQGTSFEEIFNAIR